MRACKPYVFAMKSGFRDLGVAEGSVPIESLRDRRGVSIFLSGVVGRQPQISRATWNLIPFNRPPPNRFTAGKGEAVGGRTYGPYKVYTKLLHGYPKAYSPPRVIHRSEESPEGLLPAASVNNSAARKRSLLA